MTGAERREWWHEWGALCLVAVVALPLFTPRVYASDEIKYFAILRSVVFDHDLHYANEYAYFIDRDPVAHAGLRPFMEGETPTGYRLNDAPIGTAVLWYPFYLVADVGVLVTRSVGGTVPRDGYSWPYVSLPELLRARPKVLGCETRWDKAGRMRDTPLCFAGFFCGAAGRRGLKTFGWRFFPIRLFSRGVWTVLTPVPTGNLVRGLYIEDLASAW